MTLASVHLPRIRVVLVETSHPGNIGAAARAMKTMGLHKLVLVAPKRYPDAEATARASGADDVLYNASIVDSLAEAVAGCAVVLGASARQRSIPWPLLDPREGAQRLVDNAGDGDTAIVFGREKWGLSNDELELCHFLVTIPANPDYSSLNLAMAVQVLSYEIRMAARGEVPSPLPGDAPLADTSEMERFYKHMHAVMLSTGFLDPENPRHLMRRVRRLFNRVQMDRNEVNIMRGLLAAVDGLQCRVTTDNQSQASPGMSAAQETAPTPIYLDYAATTPVDPRVAAAMSHCLTTEGVFGNPASSSHLQGRQARACVEEARAQVAALINAQHREIIWTSGATESDNLALKGVAHYNRDKGRHIVTCKTEHKAVLDSARQLETEGFDVTYLVPDSCGRVSPAQVSEALRDDTLLVSLMHVNNEIGIVQDIAAIGAVCAARNVLFHVDAAQSAGKIAIDITKLPVQLMSFSAHKLYGPKGIGALYVRCQPKTPLDPLIHGGGHEYGMRSGTLATHQIVGMGEAYRIAREEMDADRRHAKALRDQLWDGISALGGVHLNGDEKHCIPNILNVSFEGVEGESLLFALRKLSVSSGSACTSASAESSYVLRALGRPDHIAQSSLRLSVGRFTTMQQVDCAIEEIGCQVQRLRALCTKG